MCAAERAKPASGIGAAVWAILSARFLREARVFAAKSKPRKGLSSIKILRYTRCAH
jgi:hypothetical protein